MVHVLDNLEAKWERFKYFPYSRYQALDDVEDPWREHVAERLVDGEEIRYGIDLKDGLYKATTAKTRLFVTDHRIVWVQRGWTSVDVDTFQLDAVNSVESDKGLSSSTVRIIGSGIDQQYKAKADLAVRFATEADQAITEQQINGST